MLLAYCRTLVIPTPWCPQPSFHAVSENFLRPTLYYVPSPLKLLQNVFYLVLVSRLHSGIKAPAHLAGIDTCFPCPSSSSHASVPVWLSLSGLPLRFLGAYGNPPQANPAGQVQGPFSLAHCRVLHLAQYVLNGSWKNRMKAVPFPVFSQKHPLAGGEDFSLGVSLAPRLS